MNRLKMLLVLCFMLTLCSCQKNTAVSPMEEPSVSEVGIFGFLEPEPEPQYLSYSGFTNLLLDSHTPQLCLFTPEDSEAAFSFILTDESDTVLFTSEPVKAGESILWDVPKEWLGTEKQCLTICSTPVFEDGREVNSVIQTITLHF